MKWLKKLLAGRYGSDQLSSFLTFFALFLIIISRILGIKILGPAGIRGFNIIALLMIGFAYYRIFSKKTYKRAVENKKFLDASYPIRRKAFKLVERLKNIKEYKYFKCSVCNQELRVPRGKGKIILTCPKCKNKMTRRT